MAISRMIVRTSIIIIVLSMLNDIVAFVNYRENPLFYYARPSLVQAHDTFNPSSILSNDGASIGGVGIRRPLYEPMSYINIPTNNEESDPKRTEYNPPMSDHVSDYSDQDDSTNYHDKHNDNEVQSEDTPSENNEDTQRQSEISSNQEPPKLSEKNSLPAKKHITHKLIRDICQLDRGVQRRERLKDTFLTYCTRFKVENLLSTEILMSILHNDSGECERILHEFIQLDGLINQFDDLFTNLLKRYNCHNGYSVKWNCEDCKKAYKDWICATTLPFYMKSERIKPCLSFCERVEQRCPYLHPITKEQYGGQPVFICRDPNIPFVPEITPDIPFSKPGKCYDLCHLSENSTELLIDSLSKYDYGNCPGEKSIAEASIAEAVSLIGKPSSNSGISASMPTTANTAGDHMDPMKDEDLFVFGENRTTSSHHGHSEHKPVHVHNRKLDDLKEVLAVYKNQPKTHRFGHHVDHAAIDAPSRPYVEIHSS